MTPLLIGKTHSVSITSAADVIRFAGLVHGHDPLSLISRAFQLRACASKAPAADSMAANTYHGRVVVVAICRHAAATAQDAEAISRAAAGSPLGERAVHSQARP
jgi:hypothetical protein